MRWLRDQFAGIFGIGRAERKADAVREQERVEWQNYQDTMRDHGWREYFYSPPDRDEVVEFDRFEWSSPTFCRSREFHSAMNAANLWWRPIQHEI